MPLRNSPARLWGVLASSLTALGLVLALFTPTLANAATVQVSKPDPSLTASWWEKFVAIPGANALDRCNVGTGQILFLAGTAGGSAHRSCTTDKATFLVPLINVDCSTAEGDGTTFAELRACAKGLADDFTDLKLRVDGHKVSDLNSLRVQSESTFTPIDGNAFGIPPATDSPFASDGYWALITLTPGKHKLTFGGSYQPPAERKPLFTTEVKYTLTVQN
jgi:hypothetical protein